MVESGQVLKTYSPNITYSAWVQGDTRLDLPDTSGRTVLHLAAMTGTRGLRQRLATILAEAGAQLGARDVHGDTPVDLCYRINETTLFD